MLHTSEKGNCHTHLLGGGGGWGGGGGVDNLKKKRTFSATTNM